MSFRKQSQARTHRSKIVACLFALAIAGGCANPQVQLSKLQNEKAQLTARIAAEKQRNSDLAGELRTAVDRAAEAERELAIVHDGRRSGSAYVSNDQRGTPARSVASRGNSLSLDRLASEHSWLKYDSVRHTARVNLDLPVSAEAALPWDARRELDKLADLLHSSAADRLGVTITAYPGADGADTQAISRANAVAEWLRGRGVGRDRIDVRRGEALRPSDDDQRRLSGALELELAERSAAPVSQPPAAIADERPRDVNDGWQSRTERRR